MEAQPFDVYYRFTDRRSWYRVAIGLPILLAVIGSMTFAGWLYCGLQPALAPGHWIHQPALVLYLAWTGCLITALGATGAYFTGLIAFGIGHVILNRCREWQKPSRLARESSL